MGWFVEAVAAFAAGHHIEIDTRMHLLGAKATLLVDGRPHDRGNAIVTAGPCFLAAKLGERRVLVEIRQGWLATRYRLFVDEEQVPLRITKGAKLFVALPAPLQLSSAHPT